MEKTKESMNELPDLNEEFPLTEEKKDKLQEPNLRMLKNNFKNIFAALSQMDL